MLNLRNLKKVIIERNARSTTQKSCREFVKTSQELNLGNEARELDRCRKLNIRTPHVSAVDIMNYDEKNNQLTTQTIPDGQSLYNKLWNESSFLARLAFKGLNPAVFYSRMNEIGAWLRLYHDTTEYHDKEEQVSLHLFNAFKEKVAYIRTKKMLDEPFIDLLENRYYAEVKKIRDPEYQEENMIRFCKVHGDFNVSNMIVDKDWNVFIGDFADTRIGTSIEDIGRFYELLFTMGQTNAQRKKLFINGIDSFLEGYGIPLKIHSSPFLKTVRAYNVVLFLVSENYIGPYVKRLYLTKWGLRRILNVSLRWLRKELAL